jgi:argininosuccinate lyase
MQEDKEAIFDAADTVKGCLKVFTPMIATMTVKKENLRRAAAKGYINATDCADYLTKKGMPFRDAYKLVGKLVAYCESTGKELESLSMAEYKELCPTFEEDVYDAINLDNCVKGRAADGGPAPEALAKQIEKMKAFVKAYRI